MLKPASVYQDEHYRRSRGPWAGWKGPSCADLPPGVPGDGRLLSPAGERRGQCQVRHPQRYHHSGAGLQPEVRPAGGPGERWRRDASRRWRLSSGASPAVAHRGPEVASSGPGPLLHPAAAASQHRRRPREQHRGLWRPLQPPSCDWGECSGGFTQTLLQTQNLHLRQQHPHRHQSQQAPSCLLQPQGHQDVWEAATGQTEPSYLCSSGRGLPHHAHQAGQPVHRPIWSERLGEDGEQQLSHPLPDRAGPEDVLHRAGEDHPRGGAAAGGRWPRNPLTPASVVEGGLSRCLTRISNTQLSQFPIS